MLLLRTLVIAVVAAIAATIADAAGVCYSPFYSPDYNPKGIAGLLERDFKEIAKNFDSVRTYHAQFYGTNVVLAAKAAGIKVAIGIQMEGPNHSEYEYLEEDIQAAIWAAKTYPEAVLAIYAGNENLIDGNVEAKANKIIEIIDRVQRAVGERIPVGTVQRLKEWLESPVAARVAQASNVVGANIYPFFTPGGESKMKSALSEQWQKFINKYGDKARLTETGWPTAGGKSDQGNTASKENAKKYFEAFAQWTQDSHTQSPFYFMMYDAPNAYGPEIEKHFGIASQDRMAKFEFSRAFGARSLDETPIPSPSNVAMTVGPPTTEPPTPAPTPTPTPEPTTQIPLPTPAPTNETTPLPTPAPTNSTTPTPTNVTEMPTPVPTTATPVPTHSAAASGSGSGKEDIVPPNPFDEVKKQKRHGSSSGSGVPGVQVEKLPDQNTEDAGMAPSPSPTRPPHAQPAVVPVPGLSEREREEQAAREASSKVARDVSGQGSNSVVALTSVLGFAGVAAVVVITVYMRRRVGQDQDDARTVTTVSDPRGSTPSVYDDPLGTRFSSIVMITPNGDGVCVL